MHATFRHYICVPGSEGQEQGWARRTKSCPGTVSKQTGDRYSGDMSHSTPASLSGCSLITSVCVCIFLPESSTALMIICSVLPMPTVCGNSYSQCGMEWFALPFLGQVLETLGSGCGVLKRKWFVSKVMLYVRFSVLSDFHVMFHLVHISWGLIAEVTGWWLVHFIWLMLFSHVLKM